MVFGNDGDGFFNLWVLEHNRRYFFTGLSSWSDGRIFFPDNENTLFWSDILLVPSIPYSLLHALGIPRLTCFRLTLLFLSLAGFCTLWVGQCLLLRWSRPEEPEDGRSAGLLLSLLFALALTFSVNQITGYQHFQNLSWIGVIIALLGAGGYSVTSKRRYLCLTALAITGLLATAPYFAVMAVSLLLGWFGLHTARYGSLQALRGLAFGWYAWLPFAVLSLVPILLYLQVPHLSYDPEFIHDELATHIGDFFVPPDGVLHDSLHRSGVQIPDVNHESPAYLGLGFALLLVLLSAAYLQSLDPTRRKTLMLRLGILLIVYLCYRILRDSGNLGYALAWATLALIPCVLRQLCFSRRPLERASRFLMILTLTSTFVCYGFALGPNHHFLEYPLNPSIFGLAECLFPGVSNMRAIGRMTAVGHLCLGLWLFLLSTTLIAQCSTPGRKKLLTGLVIGALFLQLGEAWPTKAMITHIRVDRLEPGPQEDAVLGALEGSIAVFPTVPFHKNTHPMLYLIGYPQLTLVNGYSARSSPFFERLMAGAADGAEPTAEQLDMLLARGCRTLLVWNHKIDPAAAQQLRYRFPRHAITETFTVYSLSPQTPAPPLHQ